eukprot:s1685_g15.t1
MEKIIKVLGVQFGVLKSDTERSLVSLRDAVQAKFPNISVENATKGESASNVLIESMVGKMEGQARTLKSALQSRYQMELGPKHVILPWLVNYAGVTLSRYQRGEDGRTPYERSTRKPWRLMVPEFGECVWYQPLKGERGEGSKLEPKFEDGIYLGLQEGSALKWIGTRDGVVRAWTVKRRPEDKRWIQEELNHLVGLPWQLRPPLEASKKVELGGEISLQVEYQPPPAVEDVKEKRRKGYVPRGIYIRKDVELQHFGYTPQCDGCDAAQRGLGHRQHSRACKERIAAEMAKTNEGKKRLELIQKREEEYIVKFNEEQEAKKRLAEDPGILPKKAQRVGEPSLEEIEAQLDLAAPSSSVGPGIVNSPGVPGSCGSTSGGGLAGGVSHPSSGGNPGPDAAMEEDGGGDAGFDIPAMDIGALHVLAQGDGSIEVDKNYVEQLHEASYAETIDLLADEEVVKTQLELQHGAANLKQAYSLTKPEVAELYSPPRVVEYGERKGLLSGVAFDLVTNDEDGNPWDFRDSGQREKAAAKIEDMRPALVVGSPMCGPYSNLQNLNRKTPEAEQILMEKQADGDQHLEFCAEQYERQMDRGGFFLHEHPRDASSWTRPSIERIKNRDDVYLVTGDLCRYGLVSEDEHGEGFSKKPVFHDEH